VTPPPAAAAPERRLAPDVRPIPLEAPPDLRVVARPRRRRGRQVGTIAGALLFVALFAVAGFQALIATQQAELDDLNDRIAAAEVEGRSLDDQLAELRSPQHVLTAAEALGMVAPAAVGYISPRPDDDARAGEVPEPSPPPEADGAER
jgi:hypothetical protein